MAIILKKPMFDELEFRQKLMADENTMRYNHNYGGTIPFPKENWESWYKRWVLDNSKDYFYRYIFDENINQFVGEVSYHKKQELDFYSYFCGIIVLDKYRNKGYGKTGLLSLCNAARKNGLKYLSDDIAIDNPSLALFLKVGFVISYQNDEFTRVTIKL